MHRRHHPAKWPLSIATALVLLLGGVFFTPRSWIEFFFPSRYQDRDFERGQGICWLTIVAPPEVEVIAPTPEPEREKEPEPEPVQWSNPDWWREGWNVRIETAHVQAVRAAPLDSARVVLEALGIGEDFMTRARPDSVLAARLHLLQLEDSYRLNELKPYLYALGRAEQYRDIMSRKADMFDDFLATDIMAPSIPDRPDEK